MRGIKRSWKYILIGLVAFTIGLSAGPTSEQMDNANADIADLEKLLLEKEKDLETLNSENKTLKKKVDEAAPWFKLTEEEKKQQEAEAKAAEEKRLADEKAKKEAEEKAKKEAEAKAKAEAEKKEILGYETGITYDQLARTPDNYSSEKVKFRGKVIQVIEGDDTTQIRLAVSNNYDTVLFGEFKSSIIESRVLEDDIITIYGFSIGLITYESTMGGQISIPGVLIEKIDQ